MFHDLDSTLEELLRRHLPSDVINQVAITFATPVSGKLPTSVVLPAINLFLYQIEENRDLRNPEVVFERRSDGATVRRPPVLRVDCNYLITAWAKESVSLPEQDEHRLLGEVVRVLLRFPEIPAETLRGSMAEQAVAPRAAIFQVNQQARGDFWRALGDRPKAAFNYVVTIAVSIDDPRAVGSAARSIAI